MSDRLIDEAKVEMTGSKIVNEHASKQDADYNQTPTIAYQEGVTQAAGEAKARA